MNHPLTTPLIPRDVIVQIRQAAQNAPPANRISLVELVEQTWPEIERLVVELGYDLEGLLRLLSPLCEPHQIKLLESDLGRAIKRAAAKHRGRRVLRRLGLLGAPATPV